MNTPLMSNPSRIHPMMMVAAVSVTLVSLLGVAALTGVIPSSHGTVGPTAMAPATAADLSTANGVPARYLTADGKVMQLVPETELNALQSQNRQAVQNKVYEPAPVVHRHVTHHSTPHYAQNTYSQPVTSYQQPYNPPQQHPVVNYVNDMHPVGTGIGAVVGGLLGNQVGGGNGKKIATVAGVLMGGYAGNEIAHNRSPLPGQ
jgi:uncharacterized protein YcfJ